ncbi:OsmC family peroxiredoxin [Bacillus lacus]|uniref:OsmC family peroxiredoxin n=1 Tax=Metabacillus lacus TaxID=1983721 RepID=A0A7X2IVV6_9BACI|nr:OsmC family protein [Metabacillus lacus]MRX70736.1 OsmC family peroxiredoxin [Metabacillus lacus]
MKTTVSWTGNLSFKGQSPSGHEVIMDANETAGGNNKGSRPTELLLHAVAGCTAIDIILILKKMRLQPESFEIETTGDRAEDHPKRFTDLGLKYVLKGELPQEKVIKAIKLSTEKYCSVSHSLNARFTYSYSINGIEGTVEN